MGKAEKQPASIFEMYQKNAELNVAQIQRTRAKHRPICAVCLQEINKSDFDRGQFLFTESKASGKVYLCKHCAHGSSAQEREGA